MAYKFLVVDDTSFMRKMAADCLKQQGHVVAGEAGNGREAVRKFKELQPDVVMMDLTMPEMNGVDAIKEILKIKKDAVILVCSASNQKDMIQDALEAGAVGYLMKPFKPDYMNEIIKKYAVPHLTPAEPEVADKPEKKEEKVEATTKNEDNLDAVKKVVEEAQKEVAVSTAEVVEKEEEQAVEKVEEQQPVAAVADVVAAEPAQEEVSEKTAPVAVKPQRPARETKIKFVTSYICNWEEEVRGEKRNFSLTFTENDQNICLEMVGAESEKQTIQLSLDGFRDLNVWLEQRIEEGKSVR
ncbi:hypothetical protein GCM10008967_30940 [Bacillus carboniphilus]|uniref:Response regulatory domain-containing protein n=1 Tax=Bacillus carboniphilus TaxID=86663 RepID=A0ABP3G8P8_9BACI